MLTNNIMALSTDESQPIKISAASGEADLKNKSTVLNGPLTITRGSIVVHANKGTIHQDSEDDKLLTLYGSPITFTQKQDDGTIVNGQCNQFDYNTKTNLAILSGRAKIRKGKDLITGEKITYNTKTQVYSANGLPANGINKKQSGRITIILDQTNNGKK
ncbi:MAG: lipopolysaccharide transport periplasmic protein LptA [Neisseriaceae bacterium]